MLKCVVNREAEASVHGMAIEIQLEEGICVPDSIEKLRHVSLLILGTAYCTSMHRDGREEEKHRTNAKAACFFLSMSQLHSQIRIDSNLQYRK